MKPLLAALITLSAAGCRPALSASAVHASTAANASPDGDWGGAFASSTSDAFADIETFRTTGEPATEFSLHLSQFGPPSASQFDCAVEGIIAPRVEAMCVSARGPDPKCPRALHLARIDGGFEVALSGAGWTDLACTYRAPGSLSFKLARVDPFEAFIEPYVAETARSDIGSAGGNIFFIVLGSDPPEAVRSLAQLAKKELAARGIDPSKVTTTVAAAVVGETHVRLTSQCRGWLPFAKPFPPEQQDGGPDELAEATEGSCTMADAAAATALAAAALKERRDFVQKAVDDEFPPAQPK